jgi:hypothetical protein
MKSGAQADLVFFPPDPQRIGPNAKQPWVGGGSSPIDAMGDSYGTIVSTTMSARTNLCTS